MTILENGLKANGQLKRKGNEKIRKAQNRKIDKAIGVKMDSDFFPDLTDEQIKETVESLLPEQKRKYYHYEKIYPGGRQALFLAKSFPEDGEEK